MERSHSFMALLVTSGNSIRVLTCISWYHTMNLNRSVSLLKPLQNKKGQKNLEKSSPFIRKKTAFFSGTPNFFGPSYFEAALTIYDYGLCSTYQWQRCVTIPTTGLKISPQCSMAMALPPPSPIAPRGGSVARRPLSQLVLQRLWMLLLVALPRSAVYSVLQLLERHTKPLLLRPPGAAAACVRRELPPSNAVAVSVCRVL